MSDAQYVDATGGEPPAEIAGYITNQILVRRILTEDDRDQVFVDWPDDASLLELLGMVEFARTIIWNWYTSGQAIEEVEDDEDGD
jgi:hypothetical protein